MSIMKPSNLLLKTALAAASGFALVSGAAVGCDEAPPLLGVGASNAGGAGNGGAGNGGNGGTGGTPGANGEAMFNATLKRGFMDNCGACHKPGGIASTPFLQEPDVYQSVRSWPGIITKNVNDSILLTWSAGQTGHSGPEIDSPNLVTCDDAGANCEVTGSMKDAVVAWLEEEAKGIVIEASDAGPQIEPVAPIFGFNAVYLDALGPDFVGMALTFSAKQLTDSSIELDDIEFHPTSTGGAHVVHPLFVVHPVGLDPSPDPIDSFSNIDSYFEPGVSGLLGPGLLVLTNWSPGARLSIAFELIEPYAGMGAGDDAGTAPGACGSPDLFDTDAKAPLQAACFGCHGGGNQQANAALDMSKLTSDPAAACGQILNRVKPNDPENSQIFINTDPGGGAAHPYKFPSAAAWEDFKDALTPWIVAEGQ